MVADCIYILDLLARQLTRKYSAVRSLRPAIEGIFGKVSNATLHRSRNTDTLCLDDEATYNLYLISVSVLRNVEEIFIIAMTQDSINRVERAVYIAS